VVARSPPRTWQAARSQRGRSSKSRAATTGKARPTLSHLGSEQEGRHHSSAGSRIGRSAWTRDSPQACLDMSTIVDTQSFGAVIPSLSCTPAKDRIRVPTALRRLRPPAPTLPPQSAVAPQSGSCLVRTASTLPRLFGRLAREGLGCPALLLPCRTPVERIRWIQPAATPGRTTPVVSGTSSTGRSPSCGSSPALVV